MAPTIDETDGNATLSLHNLDIEKAASLSDLLGLAPIQDNAEKMSSVKTLQVRFHDSNLQPQLFNLDPALQDYAQP